MSTTPLTYMFLAQFTQISQHTIGKQLLQSKTILSLMDKSSKPTIPSIRTLPAEIQLQTKQAQFQRSWVSLLSSLETRSAKAKIDWQTKNAFNKQLMDLHVAPQWLFKLRRLNQRDVKELCKSYDDLIVSIKKMTK